MTLEVFAIAGLDGHLTVLHELEGEWIWLVTDGCNGRILIVTDYPKATIGGADMANTCADVHSVDFSYRLVALNGASGRQSAKKPMVATQHQLGPINNFKLEEVFV